MVSKSRERGSFGSERGFQSLSDTVSLDLKNCFKVSGKRDFGSKRWFQSVSDTVSLDLKKLFQSSGKEVPLV